MLYVFLFPFLANLFIRFMTTYLVFISLVKNLIRCHLLIVEGYFVCFI